MAHLSLFIAITASILLPNTAPAAGNNSQPWTLQRSIERAVNIAPEMQGAQADIRSGQGALAKAGEWPNPDVTLRAENNIQKQLMQSGYTVDQLTVSQSLPFWRLGPQKRVAQQGMLAARAGASETRLGIEARVARLFLSLQLHHDKLQLAEQRLRFTHQLIRSLKQPADTSGIVRYVKPLDRSRLQLLDEAANQDTAAARNSYQESLDIFRNYLALSTDSSVRLSSMHPVSAPAPLPQLKAELNANAVSLQRLHHQMQAAEAGVDLQKVKRFNDPTLTFIRERNVNINNQTFSFNGIMLSVSLPLWDQNRGGIERAQANVMRSESQFKIEKRELTGQLSRSHMQLLHLLAQAHRFKQGVLQPAQKLLRNTERNYDIGAVSSLALIDAYNTYFDAKNRYLELLFLGHQRAIDISQIVGKSLLNQDTKHD